MASILALPEASPAPARPARLGERLSGRLVVAVPVLAALIVGGWALSARQLWRDELVTLRLARMPVEQISAYVQKTDAVNAPYYYFMHFWTAVFGDSEFALRKLEKGFTADRSIRLHMITATLLVPKTSA
jgi:mannosyltransferase